MIQYFVFYRLLIWINLNAIMPLNDTIGNNSIRWWWLSSGIVALIVFLLVLRLCATDFK